MLKKVVVGGNMYQGWITHTHSHLAGECPHKCSYCYVQKNRFGVSPRYQGPIRLIEDEFKVNYGSGKTIFIEHMNDLFSKEVDYEWIERILLHCSKSPDSKYVFQSKNPQRAAELLPCGVKDYMFGTTIETNRMYPNISKAPFPTDRFSGMFLFRGKAETFITIEPILDFDVIPFVENIVRAKPSFINIGADSKGCHLPEPTAHKVKEFVVKLQEFGIEIRKKSNLGRLLK